LQNIKKIKNKKQPYGDNFSSKIKKIIKKDTTQVTTYICQKPARAKNILNEIIKWENLKNI
jgi:hypothetical protein